MGLNQPKMENNWTRNENASFIRTVAKTERAFIRAGKQSNRFTPVLVRTGESEWEVPFPHQMIENSR